ALRERGIGRGSRVVVLMPNSIEMDVAIMAVMAVSAQVAPANPFLTHAELQRVLRDVDPSLVIAVQLTEEKARGIASELGAGEVLVLGEGGVELDEWVRDARLDAPLESLPGADDLALLIFTGGSTGVPKGVDHTHRGLMWGV